MPTLISGSTGVNKITDGTIVDADINASAAITGSKLSGIGKVLQVVNGTYGTQITSTSTTFADTNLNASITPSATSSKILILVTQPLAVWDGASNATSVQFKLFRDSTSIRHITAIGQRYPATHFTHTWMTTEYLDSPSSTSSITYKTQYKTYTSGAQVGSCYGGATASITLMEIAG
jgi:hypothetical protein